MEFDTEELILVSLGLVFETLTFSVLIVSLRLLMCMMLCDDKSLLCKISCKVTNMLFYAIVHDDVIIQSGVVSQPCKQYEY